MVTCRSRDCCSVAYVMVTTEPVQMVRGLDDGVIGYTVPQRIPLCQSCAAEADARGALVTAVRIT